MDLSQIRYFLSLARTLNFTRAAEACHITQPALTKSIQRLEAELGGPLLLRERALTQLTELGRAMLPLLEQTYAAAERAKQHAAGLQRHTSTPLRVGFTPDAPAEPFMPLFRELDAKLPGFELTLSGASPADLYDGLLQGVLDVGLLGHTTEIPDRMNRWSLFDETLAAITPTENAEPDLRTTAIIRNPACPTTARFLDETKASPTRYTADTADHGIALVRSGLGVALAPSRTPIPSGLRRHPIPGAAPYRILLLAVAGRSIPRAADTFIKLARARHWAPELVRDYSAN